MGGAVASLRPVAVCVMLAAGMHDALLESVSVKWSTFIGIFENLENMSPKSMELQGNKLKIV